MNGFLRQSTASQVRTIGPFVDDTDFKTLKSALTIANTDIRLKKNGGASANKNSGGATADGTNGLYQITLDATDTATVGELSLSVKVAGALVYFANYTVLTVAVYDALFASTAAGYAAPGAAMTLTAAYDPAKTAAQAGDAMALTTGERTTLTSVIWQTITSTLTTVGSIGKLLVDNINATIASRSTYAGADTAGTTTLLTRVPSAISVTAGKIDVNDKTGFSLTAAYDPAKTAAQVGSAMTLTAAYDAAKTAATQASVNTISGYVDTEVGAIKVTTDKLDTALEQDGAVWRYTVNALEQAPVGGGGGATDWTSGERDQIRHRLGLDGATSAPAAAPSLASQASVNAIKSKTDNLPASPAATGDAMTLTAGERTSISTSVWDRLTSALATAGSIGKLVVDNLNATISSRSTYAGADTSGTTTLLSRIASALTITAGKIDVNDRTSFALTTAYDPAKTAASQTSVDLANGKLDSALAIENKLNTALEQDGAVYRFTVNALEQAPIGTGGAGGVTDWTSTERDQIRSRLGIDGNQSEPVGDPTLATQISVNAVKLSTDKLATAMEVDGSVYRFTANALELAPAGGGNGPIPSSGDNPARTVGPTTEPPPLRINPLRRKLLA